MDREDKASSVESRIEHIVVIVVLAILAIGSFVVLRPFLASLVWALILSIATWPTYLWVERQVEGRRTLAAAIMTLMLAAGLLLPVFIVGSNLAESAGLFIERIRTGLAAGPPSPPEWLNDVPIVGDSLWKRWNELARDTGKLTEAATAYIGPVSSWLLTIARVIGSGVLELTLSIIAVFFFYRDGTAAAKRLAGVVDRLAGARAHRLLDVAHGTIKGVVYGVIGTAIAQGTLIGIGLWAAGVPGAFFLALVSTFVALVPPGPIIVWLPSAIWLFNRDETAWAIFLALWGFLVVGMIDNIIKPLFISRGSAMPLLLVFLGILGGGLAFGFLGLFIGPTLLAVSYTLLREWGTTRQAASAPPVAAESTE